MYTDSHSYCIWQYAPQNSVVCKLCIKLSNLFMTCTQSLPYQIKIILTDPLYQALFFFISWYMMYGTLNTSPKYKSPLLWHWNRYSFPHRKQNFKADYTSLALNHTLRLHYIFPAASLQPFFSAFPLSSGTRIAFQVNKEFFFFFLNHNFRLQLRHQPNKKTQQDV